MPVTIGTILGVTRVIYSVLRGVLGLRDTPRLRLEPPYVRGEPGKHGLQIVRNGDRWQVAFALRLHNDGRAEARNWRVRFMTPDDQTTLYVDRQNDGRMIADAGFVGPGWEWDILAAGASDTVPPGIPVEIRGSHALNFRGKPESVTIRYWLTAEGMRPHDGTLHLECHWTNMTARFRLD